ncbi:DUF2975 domain-containing protein [Bacteroides sp. 51]|uniref:DUF2975 domain-containing protein n=1 Tax=Bacteroides sp. 51 TaxID=2302938 RepID=UPI0013CF8353|nr:DUF2975 domain-containing protein [Bacteroides sp. 51]NDV82203.1 DUF2975 domain-containing protein [Bacteroides sp. 51]
MKTKLNILCILILVAVGFSIAEAIYRSYDTFLPDFKKGFTEALSVYTQDTVPVDNIQRLFVDLAANTYEVYTDSVYNAKTDKWMPAEICSVVVKVSHSDVPWWREALLGFGALVACIAGILQIVFFFRLVSAINKSIIFEWDNVIKLRTIGWSMLVFFLAYALCAYADYAAITSIADIPNYKITTEEVFDFYQLILGLGVLVIAEVFAIGIRLREEQELTI